MLDRYRGCLFAYLFTFVCEFHLLSDRFSMDYDVKCLVKKRDELKVDCQLSEQLNLLLRKIINDKLLAELKRSPELQSVDAFNSEAEARCFKTEDASESSVEETKSFNVSCPPSYNRKRPLICKGCNRNFKSIKNCSIEDRIRA